jgi:hypothetical protein
MNMPGMCQLGDCALAPAFAQGGGYPGRNISLRRRNCAGQISGFATFREAFPREITLDVWCYRKLRSSGSSRRETRLLASFLWHSSGRIPGKPGGPSRNRTGVYGFAVRCVTTPPSGLANESDRVFASLHNIGPMRSAIRVIRLRTGALAWAGLAVKRELQVVHAKTACKRRLSLRLRQVRMALDFARSP